MPTSSDYRLAIWTEATAWALARNQLPAAQRLLVLTFDAAMQSGDIDVADVARQRLAALNPQHNLAQYDSSTNAMKSEEFQRFLKTVQRQLPFEEAERMVTSRPTDDRLEPNDRLPLGPQMVEWLENAAAS